MPNRSVVYRSAPIHPSVCIFSFCALKPNTSTQKKEAETHTHTYFAVLFLLYTKSISILNGNSDLSKDRVRKVKKNDTKIVNAYQTFFFHSKEQRREIKKNYGEKIKSFKTNMLCVYVCAVRVIVVYLYICRIV